ncbi:MAG: hypothetical protein KIS89_11975, partial [Dokdonella sp.]|nr:hypothetical protein [Dokdonella sp.]
GGRGRNKQRNGDAAATPAAAANGQAREAEARGDGRKPRREHARTQPTEIVPQHVAPPSAAKQGFFRRIGRFFGLR